MSHQWGLTPEIDLSHFLCENSTLLFLTGSYLETWIQKHTTCSFSVTPLCVIFKISHNLIKGTLCLSYQLLRWQVSKFTRTLSLIELYGKQYITIYKCLGRWKTIFFFLGSTFTSSCLQSENIFQQYVVCTCLCMWDQLSERRLKSCPKSYIKFQNTQIIAIYLKPTNFTGTYPFIIYMTHWKN